MDKQLSISPILEKLDVLCPAGYAIALHIKFTTPTFLFQTYDKEWMDYYSQHGLVLQDPTVKWGFANTGTRHWSELAADDDAGVLSKAKEHGLSHGFVAAHQADDKRSVASFARNDRNYSDAEILGIYDMFKDLHARTVATDRISDAETDALRKLSITLTRA